jgi:hypothetical protein
MFGILDGPILRLKNGQILYTNNPSGHFVVELRGNDAYCNNVKIAKVTPHVWHHHAYLIAWIDAGCASVRGYSVESRKSPQRQSAQRQSLLPAVLFRVGATTFEEAKKSLLTQLGSDPKYKKILPSLQRTTP